MEFKDLPKIWDTSPVGGTGPGKFNNLGDVISGLLNMTFYLAAFLAFFWIVWAAFQYIAAGGDKQKLAQARSRIIWAIVGLIMIALAFAVAQFAKEILQPNSKVVIPI
ncbi:MAG: hypothetical protein HYW45_01955 [Candidatus Daviesbacteria bacterium]|nr:MAG: hypothetical protein HYW45_01955 [Candidatus Daviesbacteria bacterium]